jgi:hypothetical protein
METFLYPVLVGSSSILTQLEQICREKPKKWRNARKSCSCFTQIAENAGVEILADPSGRQGGGHFADQMTCNWNPLVMAVVPRQSSIDG